MGWRMIYNLGRTTFNDKCKLNQYIGLIKLPVNFIIPEPSSGRNEKQETRTNKEPQQNAREKYYASPFSWCTNSLDLFLSSLHFYIYVYDIYVCTSHF